MAKPARARTYRGQRIAPCQRDDHGRMARWYIVSYHQETGLPYSCEGADHYFSVTQAKTAIKNAEVIN